MLDYGEMVDWSRTFDLLANRVGICNEILGCRLDPGNPFVMRRDERSYVVIAWGEELGRFGAWDLDALQDVFRRVDEWTECLWEVARNGLLKIA